MIQMVRSIGLYRPRASAHHAQVLKPRSALFADIASGQFEERILQRLFARLPFEFLAGAGSDNGTMVDDGDLVRVAIGLVHVMRRKENRNALPLIEPAEVLPHLVAGLRIQAQRRLVEKDDLGMVQKPARDLKAPFHAAREFPHIAVTAVVEFDEFEQLVDTRRRVLLGTPYRTPCNSIFSHAVRSSSRDGS